MRSRYDIVFWAHGDNETSRYIPLMVKLKERGVETLLVYQDYSARDGLSSFNKTIIEEFSLKVKDYSYVLKNNIFLNFLTLLKENIKIDAIKNKCIGFRTKILSNILSKENIKAFIEELGQKINVFDFIAINKNTKYPYGSFYIKDISNSMGKINIAIPHGISVYKTESLLNDDSIKMDFDRIFVADEEYRKYIENHCTEKGVEVRAVGDPRFDSGWKKILQDISSREHVSEKLNIRDFKKVVLYLCPNLEQIKLDRLKYDNLKKIAKAVKEFDSAVLLIKPHPRYRNERLIKKAMREVRMKDYRILSNDPAICYSDIVDFVISSATSALFDFLPEYKDKVLVYDDFTGRSGVKNLFEGYLKFVKDPKQFNDIFTKSINAYNKEEEFEIKELCSRMVAGGKRTDKVIEKYCDYLIKKMERESEKK